MRMTPRGVSNTARPIPQMMIVDPPDMNLQTFLTPAESQKLSRRYRVRTTKNKKQKTTGRT
jgi:hypothetical protein